MLMLVDTPDPRRGRDPGEDGPERPRLGVRTVVLLGGCAICLYLARYVPALIVLVLLGGALSALVAATRSLRSDGGEPPAEEP
jgi:hypothetical protein